jgi:hypothetical protein
MSVSDTRKPRGNRAEEARGHAPRSRAVDVLTLVAGILLVVQGVYYLGTGTGSAGRTVLEAVIAALGLLLAVRSVSGLGTSRR